MFKRLFATALVLAATAAHAATFNYSYVFSNGTTVAGSFSGTAFGDLVTDLSNVSAAINGVEFDDSGNLNITSFNSAMNNWQSGGVVSFSGTQNNFMFSGGFSDYFTIRSYLLASDDLVRYDYAEVWKESIGMSYDYHIEYAPSRWTLTNVSAVPEPESYALLLAGLGLMGVAVRRRKEAQSPAICAQT